MATSVCRNLSKAGPGCIVLCANTMHLIADDLQKNIGIPIIHIAEAAAEMIEQKGLKKVGLLGTRFTMEMDFFKRKLSARHIDAIIPPEADREFVHTTIFDELGGGILKESTKKRYLDIIDALDSRGAEGIVLACTEIPSLIKQEDCSLPLFDTVSIHVDAAVKFALDAV
jgi:aspartate racemase